MKRILVLATTFPRWEDDTEPALVYYLSQLLAERSFYITVLVPHSGGAAFRETMGLLDVRRFPYFWPYSKQRLCYDGGALPNLKRYWSAKLQLPIFLPAQARAIAAIMKQEDWDLVHAHWIVPQGFFAANLCNHHNVPLLLTAHAGDVFAMRHPLIRPFGRYALRNAVSCTVNSNATVEVVLRLYSDSKVNLVPMGVDLGRFHPGLPDEELVRRFDLKDKTVLGVGRFAPKEGFSHLIDSAAILVKRYPDLRVVLVGFGPEEDLLRERVKKHELEGVVRFAGRVSQTDLPRYYRSSQVFALPSVLLPSGDTEGQGIVLLEAMASGIPLVASAVGGVVDVVKNGEDGLLVPPSDPETLANALSSILDDHSLASRFVSSGQKTIENRFSWERTADRFAELYQEIIR